MFSGELYFNNVVTLGKDLPHLPIEIRKKILSKILYTMCCTTCNEAVSYTHLTLPTILLV